MRMTPGPSSVVGRSQIVGVFWEKSNPYLLTGDIADELPIEKRTVLKHLNQLHTDGIVEKRDVGGNTVLWRVNEDRLVLSDLHGSSFKPDESVILTTNDQYPLQLSIYESVALCSAELTGTQSQRRKRRRILLHAYLYLRKEKKVNKQEFIRRLYHAKNHRGEYKSEEAWWQRFIRPNLARFPTVSKANRGGTWEYNLDPKYMAEGSYIMIEEDYLDTDLMGPDPLDLIQPPEGKDLIRLLLQDWTPDYAEAEPDNWKQQEARNALKWLTRKKRATVSDFMYELYPNRPIEEINRERWWNEAIWSALDIAIDYGYVEYTFKGYVSRIPDITATGASTYHPTESLDSLFTTSLNEYK